MRETGLPQISSGDLFRAVLKQESELATLVRSFYDKGLLVPDELTIRMFLERLGEPDAAYGAMLDGFPRTLPQAQALDAAFAEQGKRINVALYIEVSEPELMLRLAGRLICRNNGLQRHGCGTPRSLHIFLAKWSFTSLWRGTALRLFKEGLCHHEWLPPSRRSAQP